MDLEHLRTASRSLLRMVHDRRGFTGAEKALLLCMALAIVLLVGHLVTGGSREAASDARRVLASGAGSVGSIAGTIQPLPAGEIRRPGSWERRGRLQHQGAGQLFSPREIEPFRLQAPADAQLVYRGGKVIASPKIYAVFWENGTNTVNATVKDQVPGFYKSAVDSPYMDWLSEYDTPTQHIGRGSYGGTLTLHPDNASNSLTNQDIQAEINRQIDAGVLPRPDENTIYMIHFPPQVSIDLDGAKSCQAFCAYHNTLSRGGQSVYYGVMPDLSPGSPCAGGCGGAHNFFDNQTSVASHELIETVTDPDVGLANNDPKKLGWYDDKYGEIGDICNAQQGALPGPGTSYTVQKEWSNRNHGCIVTAPSPPVANAGR